MIPQPVQGDRQNREWDRYNPVNPDTMVDDIVTGRFIPSKNRHGEQ